MKKTLEHFQELREIIRRLRGPGGCPWDRKQTPADVKTYLTEELYELLEAIDTGDSSMLTEEIGDLLFMILFLVNLYEEQQTLHLADALGSIKEKMIHRHPHVFSTVEVSSADEVKANWKKLKEKEGKKPEKSLLDGIPANLPALSRAYFLTSKAAEVGFDWENPREVLHKLAEELGEFETSLQQQEKAKTTEELGDILFSLVNFSRHLGLDPEQALRTTNQKFAARFAYIEKELVRQGKNVKQATLQEMDSLWEKAKNREA